MSDDLPTAFPTAAPASVGLDPAFLDGPLVELLGRHATRAAALVVGGQLVWERYWDGCGPETRFDTFSVGKAFTAAAIGLLAEDGALSFDDPACRFLPEWAGDARRGITLRHLCTMTAGFKPDLERFSAAPDPTAAALGWPLLHRPGAVWCYEQVAAHALVPIITRITGAQPLDLLQERVLAPIGARGIGWARSARGDCLGWRSVLTTARDLCLFGQLLLQRGRWGGRALLGEQLVARMAAVDPITAAAGADLRDASRRKNYGFLTYVNAEQFWPGVDPGAFALLGAYGNACLIDPRHDLVFVRLVTPEHERRADGWFDGARFANALDMTDHGVARMWRTVLAAFPPRGKVDALRALLTRGHLDALGQLRTRARRRGLRF